MSPESPKLRITEIFYSLQGESNTIGWPTIFIRLTGCPLRCVYCDTSYAFSGGEWMSLDEVVQQIKQYKTKYITVTGGEPLAQKACNKLLKQLCDEGYLVSLETSGSIDIEPVDKRVVKVMDIKTPSSGEVNKNHLSNINYLNDNDEIKFVICNHDDYKWAKDTVKQYKLTDKCDVLFSPVHGDITAAELADWILQDQLNVRFQIQLHKYLWGDERGK
jgi:7-carboxy-7-deazaguanine synthase